MPYQLLDLTGKVAVITGCNTGLGQAMAIGLAQAGCDIASINRSDPRETATKVRQLGQQFLDIRANLVSSNGLASLIAQILSQYGHIDILINNAGIIRREDALDISEKNWDEVLNVNLKSVFFLSQAVAKQFKQQKTGGKIINIASMLSYQGGVRVPSYTAAKSAIMGLTKALANEWAQDNINVNAIAPGYMATNNTQQLREDKTRCHEILQRIPAGRWGNPKDIVGPVLFLSSSLSDYVHGFTIAVDGGWLAR